MLKWFISVLGGLFLTLTVVSLMVAILAVFKVPGALEPSVGSYLIAAAYGAMFGGGLSLSSNWMVNRRFMSKSGMLWAVTLGMMLLCSVLIFWVYALAVAGVAHAPHPTWATVIFGLVVLGLIVGAIRHQVHWGRRAKIAAAHHNLSTVGDLRPGAAFKLRGRVRLLHALPGPVSGRPCALFNFDIYETRSSKVGPMLAGQIERGATFALDCEGGTVLIRPTTFIANYTREAQFFGPLEHTPAIAAAIDRPIKGSLTGRELSVAERDVVEVLGIAELAAGAWILRPFDQSPLVIVLQTSALPSTSDTPFIIEAPMKPPEISNAQQRIVEVRADLAKTQEARDAQRARRTRRLQQVLSEHRPPDLVGRTEQDIKDLLSPIVQPFKDMQGTTRISTELLGVTIDRDAWPIAGPLFVSFIGEWEDALEAAYGEVGLSFLVEMWLPGRGTRRTGRSVGRLQTIDDDEVLVALIERFTQKIHGLAVPDTTPLTEEQIRASIVPLFTAKRSIQQAARRPGPFTLWQETFSPGELEQVQMLLGPVDRLLGHWRAAVERDHGSNGVAFFATLSLDAGLYLRGYDYGDDGSPGSVPTSPRRTL